MDTDGLQLKYLAGSNILSRVPIFAPSGDELLIINDNIINVYSTRTCELTQQLTGASASIIDMHFELKEDNTLVACTESGELLRWEWRVNKLNSQNNIMLENVQVMTFDLLDMYANSDVALAFVTLKNKLDNRIGWFVVDATKGNIIQVPLNFSLLEHDPLVAVDNKNFGNIAIAQGGFVHFINYKTWTWKRLFNAYKIPITVIRMHPTEELIATGDTSGRILLWRHFYNQHSVVTSLYHWHHTAVTSIAFTPSGSGFYSSGMEAVLVKWNIQSPDVRQFLPRVCAVIVHIAINKDNTKVALTTADNAVQFVGNDNKLQNTLQDFTYIHPDKTGRNMFPMGMRVNPRNNTLVLNGRVGHLQFYSTYTKSLLYNLDIVMQNELCIETSKILYNISVTKAAFNIDWMATGEVFNDEEHLPELRLKFWKYDEQKQSYALNTNVELPHEGNFKAIEFSSEYQVDNLLCATLGEDNKIKIWSLEESNDIYKEGKVWYCVAQTTYRNLPISTIKFSQDGSILAAGCGNTLCLYEAESLKLKAALSATAAYDGCITKAQVRIPKHKANGAKNELSEKRKKLLHLFRNLIRNDDESLIKEIRKTVKSLTQSKSADQRRSLDANELDAQQKTALYRRIIELQELNLFQKFLLFQKLEIQCEVHPNLQQRLSNYLLCTISFGEQQQRRASLEHHLHRVNYRDRFKAKYRLQRHIRRKTNYDEEITRNLVPILNVLSLSNNITKKREYSKPCPQKTVLPPEPCIATISHIQFAAGDYANLVIVCTSNRLLIWNVINLRLKSVLKLPVQHLAFDPNSNLIAAFSKNNDLYIFQPNVPLPLYQRQNLPNLHAINWIPRRNPKNRSIHVDWQAQSTLYFLTENKQIMYLTSPKTERTDSAPIVSLPNASMLTEGFRYSTFGTYATQKVTEKQKTGHSVGPLVLGNSHRTAVKTLIEMSTHTMPPPSLICCDFLKSLTTPIESPMPQTHSEGDALYKRRKPLTTGTERLEATSEDDSDEESKVNVLMNGHSSDNAGGKHAALVNGVVRTKLHKEVRREAKELNELARKKSMDKVSNANLDNVLRNIAEINYDFVF